MHVDLQNVFTPAAVIEDSTRFAGRQEQLNQISTALQSAGTQVVIYGNRGVGKSSLARQLAALARGDQSIIDRLSLPPHDLPDYLVISLECDDSVTDIKALILRILTEDTGLAPWIPFRIEKKTVSGELGGGLVKIISASGKIAESETLQRDTIEVDVFAAFPMQSAM